MVCYAREARQLIKTEKEVRGILNGINGLIHYVHDRGWGQAVYDGAFPVVNVSVILYYLLNRKKYRIPLWKALVACVFTIGGISRLNMFTALIVNGFQDTGGGNILRSFTYFPLICLLTAKILREPPGKMLDYMGPAIYLWHAIGQSVCPFLGCCAGIPWKWGIWNPFLEETVFPIQWAICLAVLGAMILMLRMVRQQNYDGSGTAYPTMLVVYGIARFFLEFLKRDGQLWLGITELGYQALFMALVGTIWLFTKEEIQRENERKAGNKRQLRKT